MLVVGSRAIDSHTVLGREPNDFDFICTFEQFQKWTKDNSNIIQRCVPLSGDKFHVRDKDGVNYEFEIAWPGSSGEVLMEWFSCKDIDSGPVKCGHLVALMLKESHKYLKNSPHFKKTRDDILKLRKVFGLNGPVMSTFGAIHDWEREWFAQREKETYTYNHPKLDVSKDDFFKDDGVLYLYDHDSIHLTVALTSLRRGEAAGIPIPAYTFYMKEGSEVMTSKEKFFAVDEIVRLRGVYEESCVLALERSQIPHALGREGGPTPRWSFEMALMKVCTSITSGWFREYAWENYDKVLDLYNELGEDDYVQRFQRNAHLLKPFKEGM